MVRVLDLVRPFLPILPEVSAPDRKVGPPSSPPLPSLPLLVALPRRVLSSPSRLLTLTRSPWCLADPLQHQGECTRWTRTQPHAPD